MRTSNSHRPPSISQLWHSTSQRNFQRPPPATGLAFHTSDLRLPNSTSKLLTPNSQLNYELSYSEVTVLVIGSTNWSSALRCGHRHKWHVSSARCVCIPLILTKPRQRFLTAAVFFPLPLASPLASASSGGSYDLREDISLEVSCNPRPKQTYGAFRKEKKPVYWF